MEILKDVLRKRLAQKFLWKQAIGVLVKRALDKYLPEGNFDSYVKNDKIFVQTNDQALKIKVFLKKQDILRRVGEYLDKFWYQNIVNDVIVRIGKSQPVGEEF